MGDKSRIEWTDATWNVVIGCTRISPGCAHCCARRIFPRSYPGQDFTKVVCRADRLTQPLHWNRPRRIFLSFFGDLFHPSVPAAFIDKVFAIMAWRDQHTFQILTKRVDTMHEYMAAPRTPEGVEEAANIIAKQQGFSWPCTLANWPLSNVLLGVSVEDQKTANERIPLLLETRAQVRWVSYEPALGPVDFTSIITHHKPPLEDLEVRVNSLVCCVPPHLDWIVAGGESGPRARPAHPNWFRAVRDQCQAAHVPFFFKQWGEWAPSDGNDQARPLEWINLDGRRGHLAYDSSAWQMERLGKKTAGRLLDDREWSGYPERDAGQSQSTNHKSETTHVS